MKKEISYFRQFAILVVLAVTIRFTWAATQTINTIPTSDATFIATLQTFLGNEIANYMHIRFAEEIALGGLGTTDADLTNTVSAIVAFPNGFYVSQAATSNTYTASKRTFVYVRDSDSRTITIAGAAITYSTNLVFATATASTPVPVTPTGCLPLFYADTDGTSITSVVDLRSGKIPVEYYDDFEDAVDNVGANQTIYITQNTWTGTKTATQRVEIAPGGRLCVEDDATLTTSGDLVVDWGSSTTPPLCAYDGSETIAINGGFDAPESQQIFDSNLTVTGLTDIVVNWWGTDSAAIEDAFQAIGTAKASKLNFVPGTTYTIDAEIDCSLPIETDIGDESTIYINAIGAKFNGTYDGVWFDLNSDFDFADANNTLVRNTVWNGGYFYNSGASTASVALRGYLMRSFTVDGVKIDGFYEGIRFAGKDTYRFINSYFYANEYSIVHPDALCQSTSDCPLGIFVDRCLFSINNMTSGIAILEKYINLSITNSLFSGIVSAGSIHLQDGNTQYSEGTVITGNHFEQGDSTTTYIWFDDNNGTGFYGALISGNMITSAVAGWTGIEADFVRGCEISGNDFRDGSGGATELVYNFDSNCRDINISESNSYLNIAAGQTIQGTLLTTSTALRQELTFGQPYLLVNNSESLDAYNGDAKSSGNATIDMSTDLSAFPTDGAQPKGYIIQLKARDSGSAAAANCYTRIRRASGDGPELGLWVGLEGVTNDKWRAVTGFVPADVNGDIYWDCNASGAGLLDVWITILAIVM